MAKSVTPTCLMSDNQTVGGLFVSKTDKNCKKLTEMREGWQRLPHSEARSKSVQPDPQGQAIKVVLGNFMIFWQT